MLPLTPEHQAMAIDLLEKKLNRPALQSEIDNIPTDAGLMQELLYLIATNQKP